MNDIIVEIGTKVPLGGATDIPITGIVTKLDGDSAKVECRFFTKWYPISQIKTTIAQSVNEHDPSTWRYTHYKSS